jgi:hypothetical protein
VCDPRFCEPAPFFPLVDWPVNETGYFPPTEGYFNLNPNAFGLSFDIFAVEEIVTKIHGKKTTITTGNWVSQTAITHFPPEPTATTIQWYKRGAPSHRLSKRDETVAPAICYAICNTALLEASRVGLTQALCAPGSTFRQDLDSCQVCIDAHKDDAKQSWRVYLQPEFAQFLEFCDLQPPQSQVTGTTNLPPQTQVTGTPTIVTGTQSPPNTDTSAVPITSTPASTTTTGEAPGSTTETPTTAPATSESAPPPPSSSPSSSPSETAQSSSPSGVSSVEAITATPSPSGSSPSPSSGAAGSSPPGPATTSPSTLSTSTTARPPTVTIATAGAGRVVVSRLGLGNILASLLGVVGLFL